MTRPILACTLAALAALLSACAGPPPPTYSANAFQGIFNQDSASVPRDVPAVAPPPVGVIFSENVEAYLGHVKKSGEYWNSVVPTSLKNNVVYADADPTYFAGRVLGMLKARYPSASVVHDFNDAVKQGKRSVILIDLHVKQMEPYGDRTTKYDIDAYVFGAGMNPVSRLSGHGEWKVPFASMEAGIQKSIDQAVAELDGKLAALVR
ncbi:MAG: hypothetical protein JSR47_24270 [Proteobacteria bacterium]|nr:hypothetical protein [Pseudomonadota bacterium]